MPDFEVTLVGMNSTCSENVEFSIPDEAWSRLIAFKSEVDELRSTRFIQNQRGGQISISLSAGKPIRSKAREIDMEEVWAMLHRLRPFVLQDEQHYFHNTKNELKRWIVHPSFRSYLDELNNGFNLKTMQQSLGVFSSSKKLISKDLVMDWLNSFQYHRNQDKREIVEKALGIFGKDQDGTPVILFALVDMIKSILGLSDFIETLMLVNQGDMNEIECPDRHLQK